MVATQTQLVVLMRGGLDYVKEARAALSEAGIEAEIFRPENCNS